MRKQAAENYLYTEYSVERDSACRKRICVVSFWEGCATIEKKKMFYKIKMSEFEQDKLFKLARLARGKKSGEPM